MKIKKKKHLGSNFEADKSINQKYKKKKIKKVQCYTKYWGRQDGFSNIKKDSHKIKYILWTLEISDTENKKNE